MNRKVSVIIPVYNRQDYVQECIESVLAQTYDNFEVILIDDGSSDRTVAICREMAEKDARIRVLEEQHGGVSAAGNAGLDAADGEYVFFVDSDDVIHPRLMGTLVREAENYGAGIAGTERFEANKRNWERVKELSAQANNEANVKYLNNEDALYTVFHTSSPLNGIGGIMMRRDLIGETRFRIDLFIAEDWFFVYENVAKKTDVVLLDAKWYYYRQHKDNTIRDCSFDAFYSRFYRRVLVWEKEEAFGRKDNAVRQKRDAAALFFKFVEMKNMTAKDRRKLCGVIKKHKKDLLPALALPSKIYCLLAVYAPVFYSPVVYGPAKKLKDALRRGKASGRTQSATGQSPSSPNPQKESEPPVRNEKQKIPFNEIVIEADARKGDARRTRMCAKGHER